MSWSRGRPPRLAQVFSTPAPPIYFVTLCVEDRRPVLANDAVHAALKAFAVRGHEERGIAVGEYVIMPDHIHLFVRLPAELRLTEWGRMLKRAITQVLPPGSFAWQRGFFDHLIRHGESYSEKWEYVRMNPVRAGQAGTAEEWPYAGQIVPLRM